MTTTSTRQGIYYWKCDRPAAFYGTAQGAARDRPELAEAVRGIVARTMGMAPIGLCDGGGQGNHLTFLVELPDARRVFVRIEDGPERDDYIAVESHVMERVRAAGVPTPVVHAADAGRREVAFAWQVLEHVPHPDLNRHFKAGTLAVPEIARELGRAIGQWQGVAVEGFGPFDTESVARGAQLTGLHETYGGYFLTRLRTHLEFLAERGFLARAQVEDIAAEIQRWQPLLALPRAFLVHKDVALWNVLGTEREVKAVIDWDDCVGGDPMDDLSLLGCFHDGEFLRAAFAGYTEVRPLPEEHRRRFWLHLLRNMIFKAVIRVGAGYFDHDSRFFLIGAGGSGAALKEQTLRRIERAQAGLREGTEIFSL